MLLEIINNLILIKAIDSNLNIDYKLVSYLTTAMEHWNDNQY